ncbi:MAG: hypothetical protein BJ554DRAFT_2163 [Olpidium bornovanus]|uniref:Uncharacterized protein n=1 Tax=Olpidium bornovanus TaxID=278681 RepID=A0A8H8DGV7_9FUNG|nr:MAG: hypothetical protein BJ554DRAFT_2163 [Olpidium bornovanus]
MRRSRKRHTSKGGLPGTRVGRTVVNNAPNVRCASPTTVLGVGACIALQRSLPSSEAGLRVESSVRPPGDCVRQCSIFWGSYVSDQNFPRLVRKGDLTYYGLKSMRCARFSEPGPCQVGRRYWKIRYPYFATSCYAGQSSSHQDRTLS